MSIATLANEIRDALVAGGVRAVTDPRHIDPPCVLILPEDAEFTHMDAGTGPTSWVLRVLAPPPGNSDAFTVLADLVAETIVTVPDVQTARVTSYATGPTADPWPCIELRFTAVSQWV